MFNKSTQIESFYDVTPYYYHWNMFKCLDNDCVKDESFKCYRWCDKWAELGGKHNCRLRCLDYADIMIMQLRSNHYNFNKILPKFEENSILQNSDYTLL